MLFVRLLFALVATGAIQGRISIKTRDGAEKKDSSDVVVFVADVAAASSGRAEILQKGKQYLPRVLPVAVGTTVYFPNDDPIEHNVFSHSASAEFDLGRYARGPGKSFTFGKPGVVEVFCNVHKEMVAYVVVAPSPAFAITKADGAFTLGALPPGKHRIAIWDRLARPRLQEVEVEVPAVGVGTLAYTVVEQAESEAPHKNKFGVDYNPGYH